MTQPHGPALVVTKHGGPDVLEVQDRPARDPGPGEVVVEVAAAGVNFIDVYLREGVYPGTPPFVAGQEGAGVVTEIGDGVVDVAVGERVAWPMHPGSAARWVTLPADAVVKVPDSLDLDIAAASMLQGLTAHYLVASTYPIEPGSTALVHAAAGGVGQLLVQWITARGGSVIATAGSAAKCDTARRLGAKATVNYRDSADLAGDVRKANGGAGVDVVYDGVGKDTFDASLDSLAPRGLLALYGGASGQVPPFDLQRLNRGGSLFVTRPSLAHYIATPDELRWRAVELFAAIGDGTLEVAIHERYPLRDAARAFGDLEGRGTQGKLLLVL